MSRPAKFPKTVEAVRAVETAEASLSDAMWAVGDALIDEIGPPGDNGVNNGTGDKLSEVAAELKRLRFPRRWSANALRQCRTTSHAFPPAKRLAGCSWTVHRDAGDLETLLAAKKQEERLTCESVKRFKKRREHEQREKQREDLNEHNRRQAELLLAISDLGSSVADAVELVNVIVEYRDALDPDQRSQLMAEANRLTAAGSRLADMLEPEIFREAAE